MKEQGFWASTGYVLMWVLLLLAIVGLGVNVLGGSAHKHMEYVESCRAQGGTVVQSGKCVSVIEVKVEGK